MTDVKKIVILMKKRARGKKITEKNREKYLILLKYILFLVKSWISRFDGIFIVSF